MRPDLKSKIVYTGETFDGLPIVQFNYQGSPDRYEGFLAEDIQDIRPDCVQFVEDADLKRVPFIDYKKLGFKYRKVN